MRGRYAYAALVLLALTAGCVTTTKTVDRREPERRRIEPTTPNEVFERPNASLAPAVRR